MRRLRIALAFAIAAALFVGVLVHLSRGARVAGAEACMRFGGREACARAWAPSRAEALRAAVRGACGMLTSDVGSAVACGQTTPTRTRWLVEPAGR